MSNRALITDVDESNFEADVLRSRLPVIVAFGAPWSRACRIFVTALEAAAAARVGRVKVVKVNADNNPALSLAYEVQSIPTLLYFQAGKLCGQIVGTASKEAILFKLEFAMRNSAPPTSAAPTRQATNGEGGVRPATPSRDAARRLQHHVAFFCEAPSAEQVFLTGDFNEWQPTTLPMRRMPDGWWTTDLELAHGYHQYLFLVDGKPALDPKATGKTRNARGEPVSLVAVS